MKKIIIAFALFLICSHALAQRLQYQRIDSLKVMRLLSAGKKQSPDANMMLFFARELKELPYVAKTLDKNKDERLVVNLRQMDCTTMVENALALYLCNKNGKRTFSDFCTYLRNVRYINGEVSYAKRQHYFTIWIEENSRKGYIKEVISTEAPFTATQVLQINYMSRHPQFYPMLKNNPSAAKQIAALEEQINGRKYTYIPKKALDDTPLLRKTIADGDIIAIITNRKGLDTSHIGIAVWHKDGLHLLNASSVHKKVVEEKMTLKTYMHRHPSQVGIRVVRVR